MQVIESILADAAQIAAVRRDIHAHPELCFEEKRTSDLIAKQLTDWGIPIHRGLGTTGVVGDPEDRHERPRRRPARRHRRAADHRAQPVRAREHHPGKMHACGHDGHTAMLLAAAKHLTKHRNYDGTVYLIFQPAEEGGGGAREMIKDGLFDKFPMEAVFGAHNWPGMAVGQFAAEDRPGVRLEQRVPDHDPRQGLACGDAAQRHRPGAGGLPDGAGVPDHHHRNKRPIDAGVISVTMIHAGEATNVVPDSCEIQGTVRTFTLEVLDLIERRMKDVAEHTCAAFEPSASSSSSATTRRPSTIRPRPSSRAR